MLEAPHCRGEGVFIQCIIRGFSSPLQRNVAPEMCRGLEGGVNGTGLREGGAARVVTEGMDTRGQCHPRWDSVWGGSRTKPPRIGPLSALNPRPYAASSRSIPPPLSSANEMGEE